MPASASNPAAPATSAGFAVQAARLVEAARANEGAVRDLEETAQILAAGVDELAGARGLAETLSDLGAQAARVREAADEVRGARDAVEDFAATRAACEQAAADLRVVAERAGSLAERAAALEERMGEADARISAALDRLEHADLDVVLGRVDALEAKLDHVVELLGSHAGAYAERVEPQVECLARVAERMDAPAVADELADVLATNRQLLEAIDAMHGENADAQAFLDAFVEDWHVRHGAR